jgi:DNA mismatch repair protein MutH
VGAWVGVLVEVAVGATGGVAVVQPAISARIATPTTILNTVCLNFMIYFS